MEETKGRNPNLGSRESDDRTDRRHKRDPRSSGEKRENATQMRHELAQSNINRVRTGVEDCQFYLKNGRCRYGGRCRFNHPPISERDQIPYPLRPGAKDCKHYVQTGLCSFKSNCRFNHPPTHLVPVPPERASRPICKRFQKGFCIHGSDCDYLHMMVKAPMRPATTLGKRFDERRHGTESSSMAKKRLRTSPDPRERDPRERSQDVNDDPGHNRMGIKQGEGSIGRQRVEEAQEIFHEQGERQAQENVQRENTEGRERIETVEELRLREGHAHDLEEQKKRERMEAKLRNDQIKPTVELDHVAEIRKLLQDVGIERREDDGF